MHDVDAYVILTSPQDHLMTAWCHEILRELRNREVLTNICFLISIQKDVPNGHSNTQTGRLYI